MNKLKVELLLFYNKTADDMTQIINKYLKSLSIQG